MKKSVLALLCSAVLGFMAVSSNAADFSADKYRIEVCSIPLADIVNTAPFVKALISSLKLQHMFVRGVNDTVVTGLNFEPENKQNYLGSKAMIGTQNYVNATSAVLFSTNNKEEFDLEWARFIAEYDDAAKEHQYSVHAKNCQVITEEVVEALAYEMPEAVKAVIREQGIKVKNGQVNLNPNCAQQ